MVRAQSNRRLSEATGTLFEALDGQQAWQYETTVEVTQRGGRTAGKASVQVCGRSVKLQPPAARSKGEKPWSVNVVVVRERGDGEDGLHWRLLTSEPVETVEQIKRIVRYYQLRWPIEEYHKAWKSGVGVERLRLQSRANLERMLAITAFVAVRLLQLREHLPSREDTHQAPPLACDRVLRAMEWKVLWLTDQKTPPPTDPPSARWACLAIARLGGFTDTKRTGRPGWDTLWRGWRRLQERIEGFQLAKGMVSEM